MNKIQSEQQALQSKFETADAMVAEYDRLEAEGNKLWADLRAANVSCPVRPFTSKFSGAADTGRIDPLSTVLALRDYVNELKALASSKGLAQGAAQKPAAQANKATAPAPAVAQPGPGSAAPKCKTATEVLLQAKGCKTIEELAKAPSVNSHRNFSLPRK